MDILNYLTTLLVPLIVPLILLTVAMPYYISYLRKRGKTVEDVHKPEVTKVPSPAGPLLFAGFVIGEFLLYLLTFSPVSLVLIAVGLVSFVIGLLDDIFVLGGTTKPLLLTLAAIPIVVGGIISEEVYTPRLFFPLAGSTGEHFTIYTVLVILSIPIVANAFNMMDSFNGEISSFTLLTSVSLVIATAIKAFFVRGYSIVHVSFALPLVAVVAVFYLYNKYPSRIFDGDSGSLFFGSVFASLAVVNGVELSAVVSIIPAILNSFYILSSVRGFVERRKVVSRPTYLGEDGLIYPSIDDKAPTTLVRMILLEKSMSERELVSRITKLTLFSCFLSVLTAILTWVF
jgi:UDP-N-acetylmuramyl pentapeptide phosphotransferase/UDP-N-acetylglucosamine-1-phosphate transferase